MTHNAYEANMLILILKAYCVYRGIYDFAEINW